MYLMMAERDLILDRFEALTGARVYHIYNIPGGVRNDAPAGWLESVLGCLITSKPKCRNMIACSMKIRWCGSDWRDWRHFRQGSHGIRGDRPIAARLRREG
jgi:hypothetical protein